MAAIIGVLLTAAVSPSMAVAATPVNVTALTTWYGAKDNCPPGGAIAYPVIHSQAGGTGTWADPITFAADARVFAPGTIIYVPYAAKYFIMEDECQECIHDWNKKRKYHVDLWMGPDTVTPGGDLIACENAMTQSDVVIVVNASSALPVDPTPVFANNTCIVPAPPCEDVGSTCGNDCQIPAAATCAQLKDMLYLNASRFMQLNPGLNCSAVVPAGATVCMGGSCGD